MIQGQNDETDWERVATAAGGPDTDYSNMGRCNGTASLDTLRVIYYEINLMQTLEISES